MLAWLVLLPGLKIGMRLASVGDWRDVVHGGQESRDVVVAAVVARLDPDVGENLEVEVAGEFQPPIAVAGAGHARQSLAGVSCL